VVSVGAVRRASSSPERGAATDALLLALLRSCLGTAEPPSDEDLRQCDWARLDVLGAHHAVQPLLHGALADRPAVPAPIRRRLRLTYRANALRNQAIGGVVSALGDAAVRTETPVVLLKGIALLHTLYTDSGLRRVGDVDLLVPEEQLPSATAMLESIGLRRLGGPPRAHWPTCDFHTLFHRPDVDSVPVELHWGLFEAYLPYVFDLGDVWQYATRVDTLPAGTSIMAPHHQLAHLCTHLERHALVYPEVMRRPDWRALLVAPRGLARLAWLYDVALYVRRFETTLDWEQLLRDAQRWAIASRIRTVFVLCERALGVGAPAEVLRSLDAPRPSFVQRQAQRAILAAYRGSLRAEPGPRGARRRRWWNRVADRAAGWSHMWTSLFPSSEYLRARYGRPRARERVRHLRVMAPAVGRAVARRLR
jgi:hypothetical protein